MMGCANSRVLRREIHFGQSLFDFWIGEVVVAAGLGFSLGAGPAKAVRDRRTQLIKLSCELGVNRGPIEFVLTLVNPYGRELGPARSQQPCLPLAVILDVETKSERGD
jgi:hypothetical protein